MILCIPVCVCVCYVWCVYHKHVGACMCSVDLYSECVFNASGYICVYVSFFGCLDRIQLTTIIVRTFYISGASCVLTTIEREARVLRYSCLRGSCSAPSSRVLSCTFEWLLEKPQVSFGNVEERKRQEEERRSFQIINTQYSQQIDQTGLTQASGVFHLARVLFVRALHVKSSAAHILQILSGLL